MDTKRCSKCGKIKSIDLFRRGVCKECIKEYNRLYSIKNRDLIAKIQREYQANNVEKIKAQRKEYNSSFAEIRREKEAAYSQRRRELYEAKKAKDIEAFRERQRASKREGVASLSDGYIKDQLRGQGFKNEQITPELIELKRITLKTSRLCRRLKN